MVGPLQNSGNSSSSVQSVELNRAELMVSGPQTDTELSIKAVGGTADIQTLPSELPPHIHEVANQIGQIQSELKKIENNSQKSRELEDIRSRLLLGKKSVDDGDLNTHLGVTVHHDLVKVLNFEKYFGLNKQDEQLYVGTPSQEKSLVFLGLKKDQPVKDSSIAASDDQENVILRIDEALNAINNIIDKINSDQSNSNNKILSLTGSVNVLNAARSTVDKTKLSLNVASNAVDMIITNIKTAVMSHGKISNDIVRLVLS